MRGREGGIRGEREDQYHTEGQGGRNFHGSGLMQWRRREWQAWRTVAGRGREVLEHGRTRSERNCRRTLEKEVE